MYRPTIGCTQFGSAISSLGYTDSYDVTDVADWVSVAKFAYKGWWQGEGQVERVMSVFSVC